MNYDISFYILNLSIDCVIIFIVNNFLRLLPKRFEKFFQVVFSSFPTVLYIYFDLYYFEFVLLKIFNYFLVTLISTDSFNFKRILQVFSSFIFLLFSAFGFGDFFIQFSKIAIFKLLNKKIPLVFDFLIILALIFYEFALFLLFKKLSEKRKINNFLYNVSFLFLGKHIEISGLLDSGNSLYDTKTGKAVTIVSLESLKRFLTDKDFEKLKNKNYDELNITNILTCKTVGENDVKIPIFDVNEIEISNITGNVCEKKVYKSVVGITSENFNEIGDFECLLSREFL